MAENTELMQHEQGPASESHLTFDEVESLTTPKAEGAPSEEKKSASDIEGKVTTDVVEKVEKELADEGIKEENKVEQDKPKEELAKEYKKLKAKFNNEDIEIAADAVFTHTIDGKPSDIPLQELLNNYSGKVAWDKRFQELSDDKRKHSDEIRVIEGYINEFSKHIQNNDVVGALSYFAEFSGMNALEFKTKLRETLYPQFEKYSKMNDEQRKTAAVIEENEYLKWKNESDQKRMAEEQGYKQLQSQIASVQETFKLTGEEYESAAKELADAKIDGEVTPQLIGNYVNQKRAYTKVDELFKGFAPEHAATEAEYDVLAKIVVENPGFTQEDWADIFRDAGFAAPKKNKSKSVTERIKKSEQVSPQETNTISRAALSAVSFDEL